MRKPKPKVIIEIMKMIAEVIKNNKPGNRFFLTAAKLIDMAASNFRLWMTISAGANQVNAAFTIKKTIRIKRLRSNEDRPFLST
ncbi:hypothetical protein [Photorhabdus laumondii]